MPSFFHWGFRSRWNTRTPWRSGDATSVSLRGQSRRRQLKGRKILVLSLCLLLPLPTTRPDLGTSLHLLPPLPTTRTALEISLHLLPPFPTTRPELGVSLQGAFTKLVLWVACLLRLIQHDLLITTLSIPVKIPPCFTSLLLRPTSPNDVATRSPQGCWTARERPTKPSSPLRACLEWRIILRWEALSSPFFLLLAYPLVCLISLSALRETLQMLRCLPRTSHSSLSQRGWEVLRMLRWPTASPPPMPRRIPSMRILTWINDLSTQEQNLPFCSDNSVLFLSFHCYYCSFWLLLLLWLWSNLLSIRFIFIICYLALSIDGLSILEWLLLWFHFFLLFFLCFIPIFPSLYLNCVPNLLLCLWLQSFCSCFDVSLVLCDKLRLRFLILTHS